VQQSHNVTLPTGDVIHDFLVVNKVKTVAISCDTNTVSNNSWQHR